MYTNEFPGSLGSSPKKESGFKGSLWDDMDSTPFNYKAHYQKWADNINNNRNDARSNAARDNHQKLWPNAYEEIYKQSNKSSTKASTSWSNEFIDKLKSGNWEQKLKGFETAAGTLIGNRVAKWGWNTMRSKVGLGLAAGSAALAVGMFSARKMNPNSDDDNNNKRK